MVQYSLTVELRWLAFIQLGWGADIVAELRSAKIRWYDALERNKAAELKFRCSLVDRHWLGNPN